ncbi:hypothetical protein [Cellulophaga sp. Hel_I_12]|uniref:hypothetical protein n=1 Tax=Cellulophaga sp. Hel_I_12 TaxID=1249972 RepID=UPI0006455206|nr:hypothetical protein [Cellulophaga sp. Hel_I_12]
MTSLHTTVYAHDTEVDLTHKINTIELQNWIIHLQYVKKEINHLVLICNTVLEGKFVDLFEEKQAKNDKLLNILNSSKRSRANITECEDTLCDMAFINDHEGFRKSYMYYLDSYRSLKEHFFIEFTNTMGSKV